MYWCEVRTVILIIDQKTDVDRSCSNTEEVKSKSELKLMALVSWYFYQSLETSQILLDFLISRRCSAAEGRIRFHSWIKAVA